MNEKIEIIFEQEVVGTIEIGNVILETGGGGGTSDHNLLTNRSMANQHPISAITDLQTALNGKEPTKGADDNYVTDSQLIVISNTSGTNTGDQDLSGLQPKETGKGLSTNDYTTADKNLVATIPNKADINHNHNLADLTEKSYNSLTDIPTEFNPSAHNQAISTITNLETELSYKLNYASNGALNTPTYVDNGDGTVNVPSLDVVLWDGTRSDKYTLPALNNISLVDGVYNYIYGDYNNGNPIYSATTNVDLITETNTVPLHSILRTGIYLHDQAWNTMAKNLANLLHQSIVKTQRFRRENGLALSVFGTRNVALTQGIIFTGAVKNVLSAIDSTIDNIIYYTHVAGVWTRTTNAQLNNTQYDDGTDLATLINGRYSINWLYRGVESQKHLYCVLGTGNYTLTQAQTAQPPSIPAAISSHAVLVGRVIFLKSSNTATQIDSAFDVTFNQSATTIHNDLSGLNDGDFKHLTSAEKTSFDAIATTYEPKFSILTLEKGGTNANTANGALNQLLPSQSANNGKVLGTNGTNASWVTAGSGGSLTIEDNGVDLTSRSKLNFVGKQLIADNATNTSTDIQLFPNLNPDWYINQNVYPALEWIWKHTDGYWYFVTMVLSQATSNVGNTGRKFVVYKTLDWITKTEVCSYENTSYTMINPKIVLDSNGNIVVIAIDTNNIRTVFFDASNSYSSTVTANISQNTSNAIETTVSLNVSADNRFGVAFFQKHAGSTSYSQLMYVERSAGSGGTWGTPEILGATPLRATTVTSSGAIQLFYTSTNEPIIAFLNNASATSSKLSVAKKSSGLWNIYDDVQTNIYSAVIMSDNNIIVGINSNNARKFTYTSNAYSDFGLNTSFNGFIAVDSANNVFGTDISAVANTSPRNIYYRKNNTNTFHRAVSAFMQIGAVISANAYSTFGIYTVIPYSRQRLTDAYHLVIRTDGAIFMEVI